MGRGNPFLSQDSAKSLIREREVCSPMKCPKCLVNNLVQNEYDNNVFCPECSTEFELVEKTEK